MATSDCTLSGFPGCPLGQVCDPTTKACKPVVCDPTSSKNPCPTGSFCNTTSKTCAGLPVFNCNAKGAQACPKNTVCSPTTSQCVSTFPPGYIDCRTGDACPSGYLCNGSTGGCDVQDDVCVNQGTFNDAFYHALNHSRKKDEQKMSGPLSVYLIIHTIFMIWGVILAFASQPPENRVVHLTLAIVFSPAYVLAYYFNAF